MGIIFSAYLGNRQNCSTEFLSPPGGATWRGRLWRRNGFVQRTEATLSVDIERLIEIRIPLTHLPSTMTLKTTLIVSLMMTLISLLTGAGHSISQKGSK
jgi:hypothetical protein